MFRVMWWLAFAWAAQIAVQKAWFALHLPDPGGTVSELIFYGVMLAVVANRARNLRGDAWSTLVPLRGISLGVVPPLLLMTLGGLVLSYQSIVLCNALTPIHFVEPAVASSPGPAWVGSLASMLLFTAAIPALFEETIFRGLVLHTLAADMSKRRAIVISAAMFAVLHGAIERTPGTFLGGVVFGWMYVQTGSLLPGIFAHALHNSLCVILGRSDTLPGNGELWVGVDGYGLLSAWVICLAIAATITGAVLIRKTSIWPEDPGWSEAEELADHEYHDRAA